MRRTFADLQRAAEVNDIVSRSISGWSQGSDAMQRHYSSVQAEEQRDSISRVLNVIQGGLSGTA